MNNAQFRAGEKIRYLDEAMEGTVLRQDGGQVLIEREDEFEEWVSVANLVRVNPDVEEAILIQDLDWKRIREKESAFRRKPKQQVVQENLWEVDLHIEHLTDRIRGLTNGDILNIQLNHCRFKINQAMERNIQRMVIVHGVGQGVLKSAVHELLHSYPNLEFYDANYARYGRGATEVEIRQRA